MPRTSKRSAAAAAASASASAATAAPSAGGAVGKAAAGPQAAAAASPVRKRRKLTSYNEFVRDHYHVPEVQKAQVRDRLKILARMWQAHQRKAA